MLVGYIVSRVCLRCSLFSRLPSLFSPQNVGLYMLLSSSNRKYHPFPLLSNFSVVVCLRWSYHRVLSVSYIHPGKAGFSVFNYCAVLWRAQIIEYIMAWWSYTIICSSHCLIITIIQTYLKVFLPISLMMILDLIIIIKSEVWPIRHCLGLGHETMVCAVCLSIFLR